MNQVQLQQLGRINTNYQSPAFRAQQNAQTNPVETKKNGDKQIRNALIALGTIAAASVAIAKRKDISAAVKGIANKGKAKASDIAQEALERTAKEKAAKEAAKNAQEKYFSAVDSTVGKSAKESAEVFMNAMSSNNKTTTRSLRSKAAYLLKKLRQDPSNKALHQQIVDLVGPVNLNQLVSSGQITLEDSEALRKFIVQANSIIKI